MININQYEEQDLSEADISNSSSEQNNSSMCGLYCDLPTCSPMFMNGDSLRARYFNTKIPTTKKLSLADKNKNLLFFFICVQVSNGFRFSLD